MLTPEVAVDLVVEALHIVMMLVMVLVVPGWSPACWWRWCRPPPRSTSRP
jgi:hypothetical protein